MRPGCRRSRECGSRRCAPRSASTGGGHGEDVLPHRIADGARLDVRRRSCPGNASSTSRASCARQRLVKPAMAFCSWITSGRRVSHAATPPGPVTKPPRPTTTRGRCRHITRSACISASARRNGAASSVSDALAAQAADRKPLDRNALRRHDARFEPAPRAEPDHFERLLRAAAARARAPGTRARRCRLP